MIGEIPDAHFLVGLEASKYTLATLIEVARHLRDWKTIHDDVP